MLPLFEYKTAILTFTLVAMGLAVILLATAVSLKDRIGVWMALILLAGFALIGFGFLLLVPS